MNNLPIGSNSFQLPDQLRPHGLSQLAIAGGVAALAVIRYLSLPNVNRWNQFSPADLFALCAVVAAAFIAAGHALRGIRTVLEFVVEAGAPAGLRSFADLIERRLIRETYERPQGLFALAVNRCNSQFAYLTPVQRRILSGLTPIFVGFVSTLLIAFMASNWTVLWLVTFAIALSARAAILFACRILIPTTDHVQERDEHLTQAGDPITLFQQAIATLEIFRESGVPNRQLQSRPPDAGVNSATNRLSAELVIETQPLPTGIDSPHRLAGLVADGAAMLLCATAWYILLWGAPSSESPALDLLVRLLLGGIAVRMYFGLIVLAGALQGTVRFQSQLFRISLDGSYHSVRLGPSGGLGLVGSERTAFQSDLRLRLQGTSLISESSADGTDHSRRSNPLEIAIWTPRHIVTTCSDEGFQVKFRRLLSDLRDYRDSGGQMKAPDLDPAMQGLVSLNAHITALHAVAQHAPANLAQIPVPNPVIAQTAPRPPAKTIPANLPQFKNVVPPAPPSSGSRTTSLIPPPPPPPPKKPRTP